MADNEGNIMSGPAPHRDRTDDDYDRRYGNDSESRQYAQKYDFRRQQELSNLSETHLEQRKEMYDQMRQERAQDIKSAMEAAQKDVHYFVDVGKFIIPPEDTWAAHAELVLNNDMRLQFNPDKYFFDKIIADTLKIPALTDRNNPDFEKYRGLRTNLEVLRNDIIGQYLDDGGFDKGDEVYIPAIRGVAQALATSLANDTWWKRPFVDYISLDVANVEAVGAAVMYQSLLKQQDSKDLFSFIMSPLRDLIGLETKNWGLLPLERTPFSPRGLSAPPPQTAAAIEANEPVMAPDIIQSHALESLALINVANNQTKTVDDLTAADKALSVEDGRTILRWLRNLQGVDMDVQDFLSAGTPQEQMAKAESLSKMVRLYAAQMHQFPERQGEPGVKEGSDAAGGAAMMIAEHAMSLLPQNSPAYALLASAVDTMPEAHFERSHQSVAQLLDHMEIGLAKLSGRQVGERTAVDRLAEATHRLQQNAIQLHSVETLTEPKREESVELGREILRKLRGLSMGDQSVEEAMSAGTPEDKAALTEKLAEMVEIYRNILAEALVANPGLANDARVKKANDAIGGMTHGIKLMAAKEVPSSHAQAQQISADIARTPEEWKKLDGQQVKRLLDTMEGGLAAAVDSMEQQDQDQDKDAELAQEAIESSMLQNDSRRKRRRRKQQKSGMSKSQKTNRDLSIDDAKLGQAGKESLEARDQKKDAKQSAYMGLNDMDIASIRSLGNTLRSANSEANSLASAPPPAAMAAPAVPVDINGDGKISGDERSAADKVAADREQSRQSRRSNRNRPAK